MENFRSRTFFPITGCCINASIGASFGALATGVVSFGDGLTTSAFASVRAFKILRYDITVIAHQLSACIQQ